MLPVMQRKKGLIACGLVGSALFLGVFILRGFHSRRTTPDAPPRTDAAPAAALPRPAMHRLPQLTTSPAATSATHTTTATTTVGVAACLTEAEIEPLRRAFKPPRFDADPSLPRERQTLLSNRLLISPVERVLPRAASGAQSPTPRDTTPFLVLFNTPVTEASRALLIEAGAIPRGFFPNNALLAELTPAILAALAAMPSVQAAEEFVPGDKIQPFLASLLASHPAETRVRMTVQTLAPEDAENVAAAVTAAGGEVEGFTANTRWGLVQAILPLGAVRTLATRGEVQWIEERPQPKLFNDFAAHGTHLNTTNVWIDWGLTGRGQIAGHADTGLDTAVEETLHPDFRGRVVALFARGRPGDASDLDGHGTHTAGSLCGDGTASGGQYRGMAWEAGLAHQSVANASGALTGLPYDLYELFEETYACGARVHSDSWGSDTYGTYTSDSRSTDLFAWDHPDHLAVFAAGNAGRDSDRNGVVDPGSVGSPATAKNALAVGATENDRLPGTGGYSAYTWGAAWPNRYPVEPIAGDYLSYSATLNPRYLQGMAAFSSRGPTLDGRVKPDVVAPGTDVLSTQSAVGDPVWRAFGANPRYCFGGGTSMSAPLIAGTALLLRQYATERAGITNPSAALIRAMMAGGARSLTPGQYGTTLFREIPAISPNSVEGWGQPDIRDTVHPRRRMVRLYDGIHPGAGQTNLFLIPVSVSHTPLDLVLAWTDYPATAGAGVTRVNDLDLLVTAPNGTVLYPNGGTERDGVNTIERLHLPVAMPGTYIVRVIGTDVPFPGGSAALYVRGGFDDPPLIVHAPVGDRIADGTDLTVRFRVQAVSPFASGEVFMNWASGDATGPTGVWQRAIAEFEGMDGSGFLARIPAQPAGGYVHYTLRVVTKKHDVRLPAAEGSTFSFYVGRPVTLRVSGVPEAYGSVTPPYGTNTVISEIAFVASAPESVTLGKGRRMACSGWTGEGDVPAVGASNRVSLSLSGPSALVWQWRGEVALTNRYRLADVNAIFGETVRWVPEGASAETETALELGFVGNVPYAFCGWRVDGTRWPDADSTSPNPATGIAMYAPRLAEGDYLPFWLDSDDNVLSDWWELRYFGSATGGRDNQDDPDNDGWTNLGEFLDNTDPRDAASQPTPPAITVFALAPLQRDRPPWGVRAEITDNLTVEETLLFWRESGDAAWRQSDMSWIEGNLYGAEIDPPAHGLKTVEYYVAAADLVGWYDSSFRSTSAVYSVTGAYGEPWMTVTPHAFGLFELSGDATNLAVTVANLAGPDLLWTASVATASAPFAARDEDWVPGGMAGAWCLTTNRTWDGDEVWYCGNPATRRYADSCHAWLDTPVFTVGQGGGALFRQWLRTEWDSGAYFWDGAVVRVSTNLGASFEIITPEGGYPGRIMENPASPFAAHQPCLAGTGGWETVTLDLAAFAGRQVIVRLEFGSDAYVTDEGWYVAGFRVFSLAESAPAWLDPQGTWGGTVPAGSEESFGVRLDSAPLAPGDEVAACLRVTGNDPVGGRVLPVTVRRGHRLSVTAEGPGSVTTDRFFLFRRLGATVILQAHPNAYLDTLTRTGFPVEHFDYRTRVQTVFLGQVETDQTVSGHFTQGLWTLTVVDPYRVGSPANGTYSLTNNTLVEASALTPLLLSDSIRRTCEGWFLSGHTPGTGTTANLTFAITNHATLIWRWMLHYRVQTGVEGGGGRIEPAEAWVPQYERIELTALPDTGYRFDNWLAVPGNATVTSNRIHFTVLAPQFVRASFLAETTRTGVPHLWLAAFGLGNDWEAAALEDVDGDGMPAWAEWLADTDPTDARSYLALTGLALENDLGRIRWIGGHARTQVLEFATSPAGPWRPVATNLPPTPITNTVMLPITGDAGFYRLRIP